MYWICVTIEKGKYSIQMYVHFLLNNNNRIIQSINLNQLP